MINFNLSIFKLWVLFFMFYLKHNVHNPKSQRFSPVFSSRRFIVMVFLHLDLCSILTYFLYMVWGMSWGSFFFFLVYGCPMVWAPICWRTFPLPWIALTVWLNIGWHCLCGSRSGVCILFHWSMCGPFISTTLVPRHEYFLRVSSYHILLISKK